MPDFLTALKAPDRESSIVKSFWLNAPASISAYQIDSMSLVNQVIMGFVRGSALLWNSIADIGYNLTNIRNASGLWLDVIGEGFYDLARNKAISASGIVKLGKGALGTYVAIGTPVTLANPYTGVTYSGIYGASGSDSSVRLTASRPGITGNCSILQLQSADSAHYDISATDPSIVATQSTSTGANHDVFQWIVNKGDSEESDDHYRSRCLDVIGGAKPDGQVLNNLQSIIRARTNGDVWRVSVSKSADSSLTIYVAGRDGQASSYWQSEVLSAAKAFSQPSAYSTVIGCVYPITIRPFVITGSITIPFGTSASLVAQLLQSLADWINQLPIVDGCSFIKLGDIERKIYDLDATKTVRAYVSAYTNGSNYTASSDVISGGQIGDIYAADVSQIVINFA